MSYAKIIVDLESTGLIADLTERIVCICAYDLQTNQTVAFIDQDEKKVLKGFFDYLSRYEDITMIGFNTDSFDLPFIIRRSLVNCLKIPNFRSMDLRKIVNGFTFSYNRNEKGRLRDWAAVLNLPVETTDGEMMVQFFNEGKFDEIKNHCLEDIKITKTLYDRAKVCGLIA